MLTYWQLYDWLLKFGCITMFTVDLSQTCRCDVLSDLTLNIGLTLTESFFVNESDRTKEYARITAIDSSRNRCVEHWLAFQGDTGFCLGLWPAQLSNGELKNCGWVENHDVRCATVKLSSVGPMCMCDEHNFFTFTPVIGSVSSRVPTWW